MPCSNAALKPCFQIEFGWLRNTHIPVTYEKNLYHSIKLNFTRMFFFFQILKKNVYNIEISHNDPLQNMTGISYSWEWI